MGKTDKEVLELCKAWFEDIMERCDRLTSGNVSHGSRAIHGVAKNYAEYVDEHLHNTWKPSDEPVSIKMQASQIEYVRADVFLEKAEKFLKSYRRETPDKTGYISGIIDDRMIKDFKNYMKGE